MIRRPPRSTLFPYTALPISAARRCKGRSGNSRAHLFEGERALSKGRDRKSTRLNSSHGYISYAVFCLKKKKKKNSPRVVRRTRRDVMVRGIKVALSCGSGHV